MSIANTNIQLKKSGVTGNVPASLAYGELALNYADGRLYYKNAAGVITYIQSGTSTNSFSTINSNSSLILATSPLDTLSFVAGNNISISTDSINKKITISSTATGGGGSSSPNTVSFIVSDDVFTGTGSQVSFTLSSTPNDVYSVLVNINGVLQLTSSYSVAGNILTFTEAPSSGASIEVKTTQGITTGTVNNAVELAQAAFNKANTNADAITIIQGVDLTQNTRLSIIESVNLTQNTNITSVNQFAQSAYDSSNTNATNLTYVNQFTQGAYNKANNALAQSGGTVTGTLLVGQDVYVSGNLYIGGNTTTVSTNNITLNDSLIYLADQNPANTVDIGLVGHFVQGKYQHTGVVRNHLNGNWVFFSNVSTEPTTTINFAEANLVYDSITTGGIITPSATINGKDWQSVNDTQNTNITYVNQYAAAAYAAGNTNATNITAVNGYAVSAYNKANNALANTTGTFAGDLTVTGNVTVGNIYGTSVNTSIVAGAYTTTFDNAGKLTLPGLIVFADTTTQNTAFIGNGVDSFARTTANGANGMAVGAYAAANTNSTAISIIQGVDLTQNTRIDSIESVNALQNTNITTANNAAWAAFAAGNTNATNITSVNQYAASAYALANTQSSQITIIQGVDLGQNATITAVNQFAQSAYNKANTGSVTLSDSVSSNSSTTAATSNAVLIAVSTALAYSIALG